MPGRRLLIPILISVLLLFPSGLLAQGGETETPPPDGGGSEPQPAVKLAAGGDRKITVQTTDSGFCRRLVLQETGGADTAEITLTALPLVAQDSVAGDGVALKLSDLRDVGCNGTKDSLTTTLKANKWKIVYLAGELDHVATYSGKLILQQGNEAAVEYTVEVTRASRTLEISPLEEDSVKVSTLRREFRVPLRVALTAGQADINDLTYSATLARKDGVDSGEDLKPKVWLEQDRKLVDESKPMTLGADSHLSLELTGTLPETQEYTGWLTFHFGGESEAIHLAITRAATTLQLFPTKDENKKFTLETKLDIFTRTLQVTLPAGADPVQNLGYTASLARADGAEKEGPEIALLYENEDVNHVTVHLEPGEPMTLTLRGRLPEAVAYVGELRLDFGQEPPQRLWLELTRKSFEPTEGLALATPAPPRWTTDWKIWPGAGDTVEFHLRETAGQDVRLRKPTLLSLDRIEDGKQVDNLLGRVSATPSLAKGQTLTKFGDNPVRLQISGLRSAGEYRATVLVSAPDGRQVEGTASIFVRHHWLPAVVLMFLGIVFAWVLQWWASGGRDRAVAEWHLGNVREAIGKGIQVADQLPGWVSKAEVKEVWGKLKQKLERDGDQARLHRDTTKLQGVYEDINARVAFLTRGLDLAEGFDITLKDLVKKKKLKPEDADRVRAQVKVWLDQLYDQLERLKKVELEDEKKGAPKTLGLMRARLVELRRLQYQQRLDDLEKALQAIGQETPGLADKVKKVVEEKLTKGAKEKLGQDDYLATQEFLDQAEAAYVDLRMQQMDLQLGELEGQRPAGATDDQWQPAGDAIQAVRDKLAQLPSDADTEMKLQRWREALPLHTLAQVKVLQVQLGVKSHDLNEGEWQEVRRKHGTLDKALADAVAELTSEPAGLQAGQRYYITALTEVPWFQRDLIEFRLKRLQNDPKQLPLGLTKTDPRWLALLGRVQDQLDSLPDRRYTPKLTETVLVRARGGALTPLLRRLDLAHAAILASSACTVPPGHSDTWNDAVRTFGSALSRARNHLDAFRDAQATGGSDVMVKLERAEHSYIAAYVIYDELVELCKSFQVKALVEGLLDWEAIGATLRRPAPRLAPSHPLARGPEYEALAPLSSVRVTTHDSVRGQLAASPQWWKRMIRWMDGLTIALAFVVALAVGAASKVAAQPTFGSLNDYVTAVLWGFGVSAITDASLGEIRKKLYKES